MSVPDFDCVRLGDGITASGTVCEIHEREDGHTVFVMRNCDLIEHRPAPRPKRTFAWPLTTVATTGTVIYRWVASVLPTATTPEDGGA